MKMTKQGIKTNLHKIIHNNLPLKHTLFPGLCSGNPLDMNQRSLSDVKSDWGYVTVRQDAHMFWWLFFQDPSYQPSFLAPLDPIPVLIWLQVKYWLLLFLGGQIN